MYLCVVKIIAAESKSFDFSSFWMRLTVCLAKIVVWAKRGLLGMGLVDFPFTFKDIFSAS